MDICATDNEGTTLHIDLTVASPLTSSAVKAGLSIEPGVAAEVLARHKLNKYRLSKLTPFAVESLGRLGDHAADLLRRIVPAGAGRSERIHTMQQDLAMTLQKHNAKTILSAAAP